MNRSACIMAISCILALSFSCSGSLWAEPGREGEEEALVVQAEKLQCLPNAPTYIGIYMDDVTDAVRKQYDYPHSNGVIITDVVENGPAEKAGLREHDIIYRFDKKAVESTLEVCSLVQSRKAGDRVVLVIYRDGKKKTVDVTLGKRDLPVTLSKDASKLAEEYVKKAREAGRLPMRIRAESSFFRGRLGMSIKDLNEDLAPYFNVKEGEGVLVLDVGEDSPAKRAGMKAGDVITSVGGSTVHDAETLSDEVSKADEGDTLAIGVVRKGVKKSLDVVVEEGYGDYYFYTAPFEWNVQKFRDLAKPLSPDLKPAEREKLKEEIKTLREQLKELEERLGKLENKEQPEE